MGDNGKNNQPAEKKVASETDRARLARERREAEQRQQLEQLAVQAAAAQNHCLRRDQERSRRQAAHRARGEEKRQQVEERKRALQETDDSWRETLRQKERERDERLQRVRAARSSLSPAFAFGSSTPRLLEPVDSIGCYWAARRATSTTNVMFASAPLTRPASAIQLNSEPERRDERDRTPRQTLCSPVARRRTDLVPTPPSPRAPGRAYSMTRLDRIPSQRLLHSASPSLHHLNRTQTRSGDTTPGSRPGSAMSTGVVRRPSGKRKQRPVSVAVTGVNTPQQASALSPAEGKPPIYRKVYTNKNQENNQQEEKSNHKPETTSIQQMKSPRIEVTSPEAKAVANEQNLPPSPPSAMDQKVEVHEETKEEKKESKEKSDDSEMTGSMLAKSSGVITTEAEAKAALAERRRIIREEKKLEKLRKQRELELEAERQRAEEEQQLREEEEAKKLAELHQKMEEAKLQKAIEAQEQLMREEAARKAREEAERQARLKEEEEKRRIAEEAEQLRKIKVENEERARIVRKQRVDEIMARTRRKNEEEKKELQEKAQSNQIGKAITDEVLPNIEVTAPPASEVLQDEETKDLPTANNNLPSANDRGLAINNGNVISLSTTNEGIISANFIEIEQSRSAGNTPSKAIENGPKLVNEEYIAHNGVFDSHNHTI